MGFTENQSLSRDECYLPPVLLRIVSLELKQQQFPLLLWAMVLCGKAEAAACLHGPADVQAGRAELGSAELVQRVLGRHAESPRRLFPRRSQAHLPFSRWPAARSEGCEDGHLPGGMRSPRPGAL